MSSYQRFEIVGHTPHNHEIEAIEWLSAALPTYAPFGGYALFSFQTGDGRRYELDAVVVTGQCLYVVEMKAWRGRVIEGDLRHLVTRSPQRGREVIDHPLPLVEMKTKSLKSCVMHVARRLGRDVEEALGKLWFEPILWLSHAEGIDLGMHDAARSHVVVGRPELPDLIRKASFAGAPDHLARRTTTPQTLKAFQRVMRAKEFGLERRDKPLTVRDGLFDLGELVEQGPDYQDHWATPHGVGPRCRVRSYLTPKSDRAFVPKLAQRVKREADILLRLGDHPDILALELMDPDGPLGPALVFRGFEGRTLDTFLKEQRTPDGRSGLSIDDKLAILRRVADALGFCHRNDVVHGALSPEAVLVHRRKPTRDGERGALEVKLTRFALAASGDPTSEGTRLFTRLAGASASLYEAPEIAQGAPNTPASDLFSLGALAYFLLAEEAPASSPAELAKKLARDQALVISAVRDDLFPRGVAEGLDAVLYAATFVDPSVRFEEVPTPLDFIRRLEEALTAPEAPSAPEPAPAELDPLQAVKGTVLGDLEVLGELGSGATARVFKVRRGEDELALKVPLSEAHDERIVREGEILERLGRVPGLDRIARLVERRRIAGSECLLVQFAGDNTLADEIRAEGALSLDYARRWGDDLLTAVRSLEEAGVQHRDIKPANIGLTAGPKKQKKRLLLFDFSLSDRPAEDTAIGTPAYKDPELVVRGRWDDAADRWAAAITLHEMFTGVRPAPIPGGGARGVAVRIEADRLDADVRDGLMPFFERALQLLARERFATADDMRDAFIRALHRVPEHEGSLDDEPRVTAADLQGLGPEARVGDLRLSAREKNALDRMAIYTLHEVAQLSKNRIGGVRGVGAKTARGLVDLADLVRKHLEVSATDPVPVFLRGFAGARRNVEDEAEAGRLGPTLAQHLVEAGLVDSTSVASAPQSHVKNLIARARKRGAEESAKDLTAWLEGLIDAERPPTTLGASAELIAPGGGTRGGASRQRVRQYLGLEPLEGFPRHGSMFDLARTLDVTRALVSSDVGKARDRWIGAGDTELPFEGTEPPQRSRALAVLERVFAAVRTLLEANAGVVPIERAAAAVIDLLPPEPDLAPEEVTRSAETLVRAVTELEADRLGGPEEMHLRIRRVGARALSAAPSEATSSATSQHVLVALDRAGFDLAARLGQEADVIVDREGVVAETMAAARLRDVVEDEQARALGDRALVTLAAATAARARISARGELYASGLPAERAILLSAAAIAGRLELDELHRRVRARYPESGPFPEDAKALSAIAEKLSLRFEEKERALVPFERTLGLGSTELGALRTTSAKQIPIAPRRERAESDVVGATVLRVFEEELQRANSDAAFRVLLWRGDIPRDGRALERGAPNAEHVARTIARRTSGQLRKLDTSLIEAAEMVATERKIAKGLAPAIAADAAGPDGPHWSKLVDLMRPSASRVVQQVLAMDHVRVLTRLGLLARYGLLGTIAELAIAHRTPDVAGRFATFVVLPVYSGEGAVVEVRSDVATHVGASSGCLVPVPGLLPHEILDVPAAWVERHGSPRKTSSPSMPAQRP